MSEQAEAVAASIRAVETCANCSEELHGRYCSACGQENRNPARIPARRIVEEWLGDTFTFDSRFFKTLVPLVSRPGFLTLEYLAGRRARYVPPLRLFIFLSLLMFLVLTLVGATFNWTFSTESGEKVPAATRLRTTIGGDATREAPESARVGEGVEAPEDSSDVGRQVLERAPQVALLLVPLFALFLWFLQRREPLYTPHLIFSLHQHCFGFVVILVGALVDLPFPAAYQPSKLLVPLILPGYLYLAQRRVYGGGRFANLLKTGLLVIAHLAAWALLMMGVYWLVVALA